MLARMSSPKFGPAEGLRVGMVVVNEATDRLLQSCDAAVDATLERALLEEGEEALILHGDAVRWVSARGQGGDSPHHQHPNSAGAIR